MNKKSILAETLAGIQEIKAGIEKNANHILRSTLKEDLEAIVRKGLNESEEEEENLPTPDTDDMADSISANQNDGDTDSEEMTADANVDPTVTDIDDTNTGDGLSDEMGEPGEPEVLDLTDKSDDEVIKHFNLMTPADEIEVIQTPEGGIQINIKPSSNGEETNPGEMGADEFGTEIEPGMGGEDLETEPGMGDEDLTNTEPGDEEEKDELYEITDDEVDESTTSNNNSEKHMKNVDLDETKKNHIKSAQHMQNVKVEELQESLVNTRKKIQSLMTESKQKSKDLATMASLVKEFKSKESEYKSAIKNLKTTLEETALYTSNLSYIVNLVSENTTTKDEKLDIIMRFDKAKTLTESREIFNSFTTLFNESKKSASKIVEEQVLKTQKTSGASNLNESTAYKNPQLSRMLDIISKTK